MLSPSTLAATRELSRKGPRHAASHISSSRRTQPGMEEHRTMLFASSAPFLTFRVEGCGLHSSVWQGTRKPVPFFVKSKGFPRRTSRRPRPSSGALASSSSPVPSRPDAASSRAIWELGDMGVEVCTVSALLFASCSLHLLQRRSLHLQAAFGCEAPSDFEQQVEDLVANKVENIVTLAASSSNPVMKLALLQYSFLCVLGLPNPRKYVLMCACMQSMIARTHP